MLGLSLITLIGLGKVVKKLKKGGDLKKLRGCLLHVLKGGGESLFKKLVLIKEKNRATSV